LAAVAAPGQSGLIAFKSTRVTPTNPEGDAEVYTMRPDGTRPTQFTAQGCQLTLRQEDNDRTK
jgi:hypothetical protein